MTVDLEDSTGGRLVAPARHAARLTTVEEACPSGFVPLARLAELGVRRVRTGSLLFRPCLDATVAVAGRLRDGRPAPAATSDAEVDRRSSAGGIRPG